MQFLSLNSAIQLASKITAQNKALLEEIVRERPMDKKMYETTVNYS